MSVEEGVEELGKKSKKVGKGGGVDAKIKNESEELEKEDLAGEEVETKKKKKGDAEKGLVIRDVNVEKPAKITKKKGDDEEQEKSSLPVNSTEESAEKKGEKKGKKSGLGTTEKKISKK